MRTILTNGSKARFAIFISKAIVIGIAATGLLLAPYGWGIWVPRIPNNPSNVGECDEAWARRSECYHNWNINRINRINERRDAALQQSYDLYYATINPIMDSFEEERRVAKQAAFLEVVAIQATFVACVIAPGVHNLLCLSLKYAQIADVWQDLENELFRIDIEEDRKLGPIERALFARNRAIHTEFDEQIREQSEIHRGRQAKLDERYRRCRERARENEENAN